MCASLRSTVSHAPSPELRSGWAERKKISAISASGGAHGSSFEANATATRVRPLTFARLLAITSKSPYAVRALCELTLCGASVPVPIGELARRREIPPQFLEGLFATLRRAGILASQRGVKGGYSFARPPQEVTVLDVVEALEGGLESDLVGADAIWVEAIDALRERLPAATVAELAEREVVTELVRMLGADDTDLAARRHAQELRKAA